MSKIKPEDLKRGDEVILTVRGTADSEGDIVFDDESYIPPHRPYVLSIERADAVQATPAAPAPVTVDRADLRAGQRVRMTRVVEGVVDEVAMSGWLTIRNDAGEDNLIQPGSLVGCTFELIAEPAPPLPTDVGACILARVRNFRSGAPAVLELRTVTAAHGDRWIAPGYRGEIDSADILPGWVRIDPQTLQPVETMSTPAAAKSLTREEALARLAKLANRDLGGLDTAALSSMFGIVAFRADPFTMIALPPIAAALGLEATR